MLDKFIDQGHFIVVFIIVTILISTFAPDYLFYFLVLILIGQVLFNTEIFIDLIEKTGVAKK